MSALTDAAFAQSGNGLMVLRDVVRPGGERRPEGTSETARWFGGVSALRIVSVDSAEVEE